MRFHVVVGIFSSFVLAAWAGAGAGNGTGPVNPVPPPGISILDSERADLERSVADLGREIESLRSDLKKKPALLELLPDVEIYHKAVDWALRYNEFYKTNETKTARLLLQRGQERAAALRAGVAPWTTTNGLVVRGYVSKIDGSIQPYGLVLPASYHPGEPEKFRLDFWFHGRGEQLSELSFLADREKSIGEFSPPNTIMLHLYGRYCNANRFAGEVDLFEALDNVRKHYPIDENRLVVRGFSMGGAVCWQFATHYAGLWAAAAPGAGFTETAAYLKLPLEGPDAPPWYQQKLWHLYDSKDYAANLFNCPVVAYSGGIDPQKQAADVMAKALADEGMTLTHIIGPNTPHRYEPLAKLEVSRRIDSIATKGRDPLPEKVRFTTWTLRYNQMAWITIDSMGHEWERARTDAQIDRAANAIRATTTNVTGLTFSMSPGWCPLDNMRPIQVVLDGQTLDASPALSDRSWTAHFHQQEGKWSVVESTEGGGLRKTHGLQGPIDDAFMDAFIMVRPTGQAMSEKTGQWETSEMAHAMDQWRRQFRGEARIKDDTDITDPDIASNNLVLWGDPQSNKLLAKIAGKLPIQWDAQGIHFAGTNYSAGQFVPVLIYPNPLNPKHYVVLNSGFTFREADYVSNARQNPKLPDWAIVDINQPATLRVPGGIVNAGFFDEQWKLDSSNDK